MLLKGISPSSELLYSAHTKRLNHVNRCSESNVQIHTFDPPLPLAEQAPEPLNSETRPFSPLARDLVGRDAGKGASRSVKRLHSRAVEDAVSGGIGCGGHDGGRIDNGGVGGIVRVYPGFEGG